MTYRLDFHKKALEEMDRLTKSGEESEIRKVQELLAEISQHPRTGTGRPEELKNDLEGCWSRHIDKKDRLVYQVDEANRKILILSVLGHYDGV